MTSPLNTETDDHGSNQALITIVTIGRNDIGGLKRTFASLRDQSYRDVEHIIIDGASNDGSADWARNNAVFANTIVVSEPDTGIYDAMNKGLQRAAGKVVCFLNSGDCFGRSDVLDLAAESYEAEGWKWALGMSQMVDHSFTPTRRAVRARYSWWYKTFWECNLSQQAVFIQTDVARQLGGFDERYSVVADYHLLTRVGRLYQPAIWSRMVAITLEGGVSVHGLAYTHWQLHAARVDLLGLKRPLARADAAWTIILIAKCHTRRLLRSVLPNPSSAA